MLIVLGLIDVVMISNLLVMVIVGGYETFVSRLNLQGHPDQPEWLSHVNASVLKVKLAMAIIGISSIHLLKTFIEAGGIGGLPLCSTMAGMEAAQALSAAGLHSARHARPSRLPVSCGKRLSTAFSFSPRSASPGRTGSCRRARGPRQTTDVARSCFGFYLFANTASAAMLHCNSFSP